MAKILEDEEKETAAAAEIKHRSRRAPLQLEVLGADNVQAKPTPDVGIFRVMLFRTRVLRLDGSQFRGLDPGMDWLQPDRKREPFGPAPGAPVRQRLPKLGNLMGKVHPFGRIAAMQSAPATGERTRRFCLTAAPLVAAAIATSTTVATTTTAAVTATTATAAVAAAAATVTTPTTAATWRTRFARARFVNSQRPTFNGLAIELGDRFLRIGLARHGHEGEAARFTGELVLHQRDLLDRADCGEHVLKIGFGGVEGKIPYV
jgi:hypothetical protein